MTLKDKLGLPRSKERENNLYCKFGVFQNPFPPASQPMGHWHLETSADDFIIERLRAFQGSSTTQVIVVEGTQGTGKTNLLEYYDASLGDAFEGEPGHYIIHYYSDPQPGFDALIRMVFQHFGADHLVTVAKLLSGRNSAENKSLLSALRGPESATFFRALAAAANQGDENLRVAAELGVEWLLGLRLLKRHTEILGVKFRLDSVEAKTQALRDLILLSNSVGHLKAVFLLLDELEKQDYSVPKLTVLRYLSAIRALIDSLPRFLFMILAITPDARIRYFQMLPALGGRLANVAHLHSLQSADEAWELYSFYLAQARLAASKAQEAGPLPQGDDFPLGRVDVNKIYSNLLATAERIGEKGVRQRALLNTLHDGVGSVFSETP